MKAVLQAEYGPPEALKVAEVERPTPKDRQVLVRVHAASVNARDWRGMRANPPRPCATVWPVSNQALATLGLGFPAYLARLTLEMAAA